MQATTEAERKLISPHMRNRDPKPSNVSIPPHRRKPSTPQTPDSQCIDDHSHDKGQHPPVLPQTTAVNGASMTTPPSPPDSSVGTKKKSTTPATESVEQRSNSRWQGRKPPRSNWRAQNTNSRQQNPKPRQSAWIKAKDMKPRPEDLDSDGGIFIDDGWEAWKKNHSEWNADQPQLHDWNGDWLPAPVEWAGRHQYTHSDLGKLVDDWSQGVWRAYENDAKKKQIEKELPCRIDSITLYTMPYMENWTQGIYELRSDKKGLELPEQWKPDFALRADPVAIKEWIPKFIEGESPRNFWKTLPQRAPDTASDVGLDGCPWFDLVHKDHCLLSAPEVPEARCDPEDTACKLPGYEMTAQKAIDKKETATQLRARKQQEKRACAVAGAALTAEMLAHKPEKALNPAANIYVRPVTMVDIGAITEIYNYYVEYSIVANEFTKRTHDHMRNRVRDAMATGLPCIVAVHRNQKKGRGNFKGPNVLEHVVGYAGLEGEFLTPPSRPM